MVTNAKTTYMYNYNPDVYCGKDPDFEHLENFGEATGVIIKPTRNLHGKGHISPMGSMRLMYENGQPQGASFLQ